MNKNIIFFYGIKFYNLKFVKILNKLNLGGYLVAPAASALTKINLNRQYFKALKRSSIAIFDSGYMCILLRLFKKIKVKKFSGYLFLKKLLSLHHFNKKILSIDPNKKQSDINRRFLCKKGFQVFTYVAPFYRTNFHDIKLISLIKKVKPNYILINIAGEKQEILAYEINKFYKKIPILCTGAAIGFLTNSFYKKRFKKESQAPINDYIDKYYLGWFMRLLYNPIEHKNRFFESLKLIKLFY
jgi:UDP-N-acetyl-D-mannosaminuronic acid transferase (WecB/TagA/CpsF family)